MAWNVPDGTLLDYGAQQYAPFASGRPPMPVTGLEGTPFQHFGMLGQLIGSPIMNHFMGPAGLTPLGVTDQSVMDLLRRQQFSKLHTEAIQQAAVADRENYIRTMRGAAFAAGVPFGPDQRAAAGAAADMMTKMAPFAAMYFPELLDQLGGHRGSAAVLASRMAQGGRYRVDPVTGQLGLSLDTVSQFAKSLYHDVYEAGDVASLGGITAGQFGGLFDELQRRGMAGASPLVGRAGVQGLLGQMGAGEVTELFKAHGINHPGDLSQLSVEDIDKLGADSQIADKLRRFDASAVKRSVESYVKAVGAVRDIFGDLGRPDAPMAQLIASLEQLTGGSLSQIDPGKLAMMVRQTHELTRMGGVSIDNALLLQQHTMARASGLGIEPVFGVQAMQGALGFGNAYRTSGLGAVTAWGVASPEQLQQLDANLRVNASSSELANRLAVLRRVRRAAGGFQAGSEAEALMNAIERGDHEYDFNGRLIDTGVSQADLIRILGNAKDLNGNALPTNEGTVRALLRQTGTNRQEVFEGELGDYVRMRQGRVDFLRPNGFISRLVQSNLSGQLRGLGIGGPDAAEAIAAINASVVSKIAQMSPAEMSGEKRDEILGKAIQEALEAKSPGVVAALKANGQWGKFGSMASDQLVGYIDEAVRSDPNLAASFGTFQNLHRVSLNDTTLRAGRAQQLQAKMAAMQAEAYMPLGGKGSLWRNFVDALQNTNSINDPDVLSKIIGETLGGRTLPGGEVGKELEKLSVQVGTNGQDVNRLYALYEKETDPDAKRRLHGEYKQAVDKLRGSVKEFAGKLSAAGLSFDRDLPMQDIDHAMQMHDLVGKERGAGAVKDWKAYWTSDTGQVFRRATHYFQQDAMHITQLALDSEAVMQKLGPEGLERVKGVRAAAKDLSELAYLYAGGDMGRLLRGDFNASLGAQDAEKLRDHVTKLLADERGGLEEIRKSMGKEGAGAPLTQEQKDNLRKYRESESQTSVTLLRRVLKAHGREAKDDDGSFQKAASVQMSAEARDRLSVLAESSEAVLGIAGRQKLSIDQLMAEYGKAQSDKKEEEFFKKFGLSGDEQERFKRQAAFLKATTLKTGPQFRTDDAEQLMNSLNTKVDMLGTEKKITAVVEPGTKWLFEGVMRQDGKTVMDATPIGNEGQQPTDNGKVVPQAGRDHFN